MITWYESDVLANGIRLHVYRTGADRRPVLLVHGITDNGLCWPGVTEALAPEYEVITYDARCHGKSETPHRSPTWQDLADDMASLVGALGLTQPYALGHSMGGATVAMAAADHPSLLGKAALSDPALGIGSDDPKEASEGREAWRAELLAQKALSASAIIAAGREQHPDWPDYVFEGWALAKQQVDPSALDLVGAEIAEWHAVCSEIACPTLLLWADTERGSIVSDDMAQEMMRLLASGEQAHFATGHNIRREAPEAYIKAVKAFFRS